MRAPRIQNETKYDGREVAGLVRWVFRYFDLDGTGVIVKVKRTARHGWGGRFYSNPHVSGGYVWKEAYRGAGYGEYVEVRPNVPADCRQLIVCRIGDQTRYPRDWEPYERRGNPEPWELADWKEALVTLTAHEAIHLRQYRTKPRKRGRFNEKETEWGAYRAWKTWRKEQSR